MSTEYTPHEGNVAHKPPCSRGYVHVVSMLATQCWSAVHVQLITQVRVKFARRTSGIPGVPGRPEPRMQGLPYYEDDNAMVKEVGNMVASAVLAHAVHTEVLLCCAPMRSY